MNTTNLQIPLTKDLKMTAQQAAFDMGFSSLQELVRIFLKKISTQTIQINFVEEERLSTKAEKRYMKMIAGIKSGKGWYEAKNVNDLMRQLNGK
jgi:antitoxin component of RelBE/YafQ-DinJ toxin-antitoxin module